ncbi:putative glycolipid-binding domain-containing protein [Kocuria marina]|uniref:putative glycolipid-binding domain-containing protein n=1 Tax=Kocuria marina TaxID=223184 RepID=UPI0021A67CD8|nr:putative glycolipid-binding domain-containing protein [Kocuria marina]MCT1617303.1 putative glycolipid-binding domain-containing protein [Kocuria marina]
MTTQDYTWIGIDDPSRNDAAQVEFSGSGMRAAGSSITNSYVTSWTLNVDDHWRTRRIIVTATGETWSRYLDLSRSPSGNWLSETAVRGATELPSPGIVDGTDLTDAVDCDLGKCPLTNVMPIRRLGLLQGGVPEIPLVMAWIEVPSLRVIRSDQVYASGSGDGLVRYTSCTRDFSAELTVDPQGVVIDYPHLARRPGRL